MAQDNSPAQPIPGGSSPGSGFAPDDASLTDAIGDLFSDGRTYVEAELQFQKSRAAFAFDRGRKGAVFGVAALILVHLALIALVVGLLFALAPAIGPWGATAVVVGVLLIGAIVLALAAKRRFAGLASAFADRET